MSLESKIDKLTATIEKLIDVMSTYKAPEQLELPLEIQEEPPEAPITREEIGTMIKTIVRQDIDNKNAVKNILARFNANKTGDLKDEHLANVYGLLSELL